MPESSGTPSIDVLQRTAASEGARSPSVRGFDTCTGSPKGAGLGPGEVDTLIKQMTSIVLFSLFLSPSSTNPL